MAGKEEQKQTTDGSIANNGDQEQVENENRESEENDVLDYDDYQLFEGINITSSSSPDPTDTLSPVKITHDPLSAFLKCCMKIYRGSDNEIMIEGRYCNHGLVLMGYKCDEKELTNYWIVKNSEGARWGDKGYGKVARDSSLPDNRKHLLTSTKCPIFE